jgi:hypothetical protein
VTLLRLRHQAIQSSMSRQAQLMPIPTDRPSMEIFAYVAVSIVCFTLVLHSPSAVRGRRFGRSLAMGRASPALRQQVSRGHLDAKRRVTGLATQLLGSDGQMRPRLTVVQGSREPSTHGHP